MARNLTDPISGFLRNKKYLIHDRDRLPGTAWWASEELPESSLITRGVPPLAHALKDQFLIVWDDSDSVTDNNRMELCLLSV